MSERQIADRKPAVLEVEPGTYYWCRCGRSADQPFCDGSHKVTELSPMQVEVAEKKRAAWCQCKHTANEPYCDGTHKNLGLVPDPFGERRPRRSVRG